MRLEEVWRTCVGDEKSGGTIKRTVWRKGKYVGSMLWIVPTLQWESISSWWMEKNGGKEQMEKNVRACVVTWCFITVLRLRIARNIWLNLSRVLDGCWDLFVASFQHRYITKCIFCSLQKLTISILHALPCAVRSSLLVVYTAWAQTLEQMKHWRVWSAEGEDLSYWSFASDHVGKTHDILA